MPRCKSCGHKDMSTNSPVLGLCMRCVEQLETSALGRGLTLLEAPTIGESDERQILGVKLWYWRGQWRAL